MGRVAWLDWAAPVQSFSPFFSFLLFFSVFSFSLYLLHKSFKQGQTNS
jgi:hypothetical protein